MNHFIIKDFTDGGSGNPQVYVPQCQWNYEHDALDEVLYMNWEFYLSYVDLYRKLYSGKPVTLIYGSAELAYIVRTAPYQYEIHPIE